MRDEYKAIIVKKICKGCGRNRKIGKFGRDSKTIDGKRIYCRDCISILNRRYRTSPFGRIKHQKSVDNWKKRNKLAIKEYNKAYYRKKRHIILYNKRAREETECVLIVEKFESDPIIRHHDCKRRNRNNEVTITIDPKPKSESNRIQI